MRHEPSFQDDEWAKRVIGAAIEVHRVLGPGFLENVYEDALACEFAERGIPFFKQFKVEINYKGQSVGEGRLDFLVAGRLIVEPKAVEQLAPIHTAQVISYLKAMNLPLGLLLNFNVELLKTGIKRVIVSS